MEQERVYSNVQPDTLTHLILRGKSHNSNVVNGNLARNDLIEASNSLQASWIQMKESETFIPHVHEDRIISQRLSNTQECWVVIEGMIEASLYDTDTTLICKRQLEAGDFVFTLKGGHNYMCLSQNAQVCEIKSGPYDTENDKRRF
jgi:cupin fold WbuC family metalloprotein